MSIKQEQKETPEKGQKEKIRKEIKQSGMLKHKAPGQEGTIPKEDVKPHVSSNCL